MTWPHGLDSICTMTRNLVLLAFTAALTACSTGPGQTQWAVREGVDLNTDRALCRRAAAGIDVSAYGGEAYSDGRYGAAAAMASKLDRESIKAGGAAAVYDAVFDDCMIRKGWAKAQ